MRASFLSVAFLVAVSTVRAEPELKGSPTELANYLAGLPRTVVVTGESELKVPADRAIVTLQVRTENRSLQEAIRANEHVRAKIVAALKERGVPTDAVKVSKFSSTPKYAVFGDKIKTYTVENSVKVSAHDEKEFQAAAQVADGSPEVHYEGITFEHTNKDELKNKVLSQACHNAEARKKVYEQKLGVHLVARGFTDFEEGQEGRRRMASTPSYTGRPLASSSKVGMETGTAPEISETVSSFGEITFKTQIAIEYSVQSK